MSHKKDFTMPKVGCIGHDCDTCQVKAEQERNFDTKNRNKVSRARWKTWSNRAKHVFNTAYSFYLAHKHDMTHPKTKVSLEQWETVAWNAAWVAADACDNVIPSKIITL